MEYLVLVSHMRLETKITSKIIKADITPEHSYIRMFYHIVLSQFAFIFQSFTASVAREGMFGCDGRGKFRNQWNGVKLGWSLLCFIRTWCLNSVLYLNCSAQSWQDITVLFLMDPFLYFWTLSFTYWWYYLGGKGSCMNNI